MAKGRFDNPIVAALAGFFDLFRKQGLSDRLKDTDRIDSPSFYNYHRHTGTGGSVDHGEMVFHRRS